MVPEAVPDLEFAAWLDGRLPEAAAARIDAAVAGDAELRRAALDLADILGKPLPVAPERLAVRAQALVGFAAERQLGHGGGFFGRLFSSGTRYALQRAAMAAVAMVIAGAGFIVAICGEIMTMPGLPRRPAAEQIGVGPDGRITGLS